jgi:methyl-accepting chemotaxis protein
MYVRRWLSTLPVAVAGLAAGLTAFLGTAPTISLALGALAVLLSFLAPLLAPAAPAPAAVPAAPAAPAPAAVPAAPAAPAPAAGAAAPATPVPAASAQAAPAPAATVAAALQAPTYQVPPATAAALADLQRIGATLTDAIAEQEQQVNLVLSRVGEVNTMLVDLSRQAEQQRDHLRHADDVARALDSVSQFVARAAEEMQRHVAASREAAAVAGKSLNALISTSQSAGARAHTIAGQIQELSMYTQEIGEILAVIRSIADQTNMLSLNAAIEANRAGVQGRGFAVVAEEVRKLADRSRIATRQIEELVSTIQKATNTALVTATEGAAAMEKGMKEVEGAMAFVENGLGMFNTLDETARNLAAQAETNQQNTVVLVKAVQGMRQHVDQVAQTTRKLAEGTWLSSALAGLKERAGQVGNVGRQMVSAAERANKY